MKRNLFSVFWVSQSMIEWKLLGYNRIVNVDVYTKQLQKPADPLKKKQPRRPEVAHLHDSASAQTLRLTPNLLERID